jgi:hypothetical protein
MTARDIGVFTHDADDVEIAQAANDGVDPLGMVVEHRDGRLAVQHRPVGHGTRDILVVVEHGDFESLAIW